MLRGKSLVFTTDEDALRGKSFVYLTNRTRARLEPAEEIFIRVSNVSYWLDNVLL